MCSHSIPFVSLGFFVQLDYLLTSDAELFHETLDLDGVLILLDDTLEGLALTVLDSLHAFQFFFKPSDFQVALLELVFELYLPSESGFVSKLGPERFVFLAEDCQLGVYPFWNIRIKAHLTRKLGWRSCARLFLLQLL